MPDNAPVDLDLVDRLCAEATEGPWEWEAADGSLLTLGTVDNTDAGHVLSAHRCRACEKNGGPCLWPKEHDAEFIAHSRSLLPSMAAELRELRGEVERLRKIEGAARAMTSASEDELSDAHDGTHYILTAAHYEALVAALVRP